MAAWPHLSLDFVGNHVEDGTQHAQKPADMTRHEAEEGTGRAEAKEGTGRAEAKERTGKAEEEKEGTGRVERLGMEQKR